MPKIPPKVRSKNSNFELAILDCKTHKGLKFFEGPKTFAHFRTQQRHKVLRRPSNFRTSSNASKVSNVSNFAAAQSRSKIQELANNDVSSQVPSFRCVISQFCVVCERFVVATGLLQVILGRFWAICGLSDASPVWGASQMYQDGTLLARNDTDTVTFVPYVSPWAIL